MQNADFHVQLLAEIRGQYRTPAGVLVDCMIDMNSVGLDAEIGLQLFQTPKQGGGIWSSRERDNDTSAGSGHFVPYKKLLELVEEGHALR
jgi:hypothetical protein